MATGIISEPPGEPGVLCLPFPMKFPPDYGKVFRYGGRIEHFQKRPYLSPYAEARGIMPGSQEFDKRAVAIMHEILSFTIEKRLVTDHLTHFRSEFVMPQKLMRLLLKHFGIFYVSERGKRLSVFLTEAYDRSELIDKCPLVLWKEKILRLAGYRGRRKRIKNYSDFSDSEDDLIEGNHDNKSILMEVEDGETFGLFRFNDVSWKIGCGIRIIKKCVVFLQPILAMDVHCCWLSGELGFGLDMNLVCEFSLLSLHGPRDSKN
ncbi:3-ketoacyl-CoA synthase [Musa troglodytarum]|uniref:3-ketoacyl-CoA synthase n=1 Tax=Musa troglodytarum TaxID=320322 RepID=A0A9E7I1L7_9LILI|nr:3-ketoacyl-CoA synthase [Musa troglodytarum]URE44010.1 3-ketoacyl-CoA synthase [Musa troglodytarum]